MKGERKLTEIENHGYYIDLFKGLEVYKLYAINFWMILAVLYR